MCRALAPHIRFSKASVTVLFEQNGDFISLYGRRPVNPAYLWVVIAGYCFENVIVRAVVALVVREGRHRACRQEVVLSPIIPIVARAISLYFDYAVMCEREVVVSALVPMFQICGVYTRYVCYIWDSV